MSVRLPVVGNTQLVIIVVDVNQDSGISVPRKLTRKEYHLGKLRENPLENVMKVSHVAALQEVPEKRKIIKLQQKKEKDSMYLSSIMVSARTL